MRHSVDLGDDYNQKADGLKPESEASPGPQKTGPFIRKIC